MSRNTKIIGKVVKQVNNLKITRDAYNMYRVYSPDRKELFVSYNLRDTIARCQECKQYTKSLER